MRSRFEATLLPGQDSSEGEEEEGAGPSSGKAKALSSPRKAKAKSKPPSPPRGSSSKESPDRAREPPESSGQASGKRALQRHSLVCFSHIRKTLSTPFPSLSADPTRLATAKMWSPAKATSRAELVPLPQGPEGPGQAAEQDRPGD